MSVISLRMVWLVAGVLVAAVVVAILLSGSREK